MANVSLAGEYIGGLIGGFIESIYFIGLYQYLTTGAVNLSWTTIGILLFVFVMVTAPIAYIVKKKQQEQW